MARQLTETTGNTPLLSLTRTSRPTGATMLGKQESRNPMGSVKCRIAVSMIDAGLRGRLDHRRHHRHRADQRQHRPRPGLCLRQPQISA